MKCGKKIFNCGLFFSDLLKEKVAIAVHISLKGKALAATTEMSIEELKCDAGLTICLLN